MKQKERIGKTISYVLIIWGGEQPNFDLCPFLPTFATPHICILHFGTLCFFGNCIEVSK